LAWDILSLDPPRALKRKRKQGVPGYSAAGFKYKSKTGALMRSMVLPGFGQLYSGRKISGISFLLLEAGMIGMAAKSNSDYASFQTEYVNQLANYNGATVPEDIAKYKARVEKAWAGMTRTNDQLTLFSAAAGGLWLINAIHAFLTGPDLADNTSKLPIRLAYDPTLNQTQLRWEISL